MYCFSVSIGGRAPLGQKNTRRLENLIRPVQLFVFALQGIEPFEAIGGQAVALPGINFGALNPLVQSFVVRIRSLGLSIPLLPTATGTQHGFPKPGGPPAHGLGERICWLCLTCSWRHFFEVGSLLSVRGDSYAIRFSIAHPFQDTGVEWGHGARHDTWHIGFQASCKQHQCLEAAVHGQPQPV